MRSAPLALLIAAGCLAAGCSSMLLGGGEPTDASIGGESRSAGDRQGDNALSQAVLQAMLRDPLLSDQRVFAVANSGVITLRGRVGSFEARDRALEIASTTAGVSRVDNQVEVNTRD